MVKKSEFQDELKKFESILESLEKYPDFKKLFLPKDLEAMRKALENQTSISGDSLSRIKVALVRFNAKINKTRKKPKSELKKPKTSNSSNNKPNNNKLIKKLQKNIVDKDTQIKELKSKIEELKSRFENQIEELEKNYHNTLDSKDEEISELKIEKNKLDLNNKSLKARKKELEKKLKNKDFSELQSKYNSLKEELEESKKSDKLLTEAKAEIQELNSRIENKDKTIKSLKEEIDSFKDPEKLIETFVSVVQEDARFLAIEAAKDLLEKERKQDSRKISGLTEIINSRLSDFNDRLNNLQALVQQKDIEKEIHESDPDFSEEDLKIMKSLNILFIQNGSYKNLSQTQKSLLNSFGGKSDFFTKADKTSKTKDTLKSAIEGKKFDYIVLYLDGIGHTITNGINEYQEPKIILVRKGLENHILIKSQILERYRKHQLTST